MDDRGGLAISDNMNSIVIFVLYSIIGVIAIVVNMVEIVLITKGKRKLKSYKQLLLSLAVCDLLVGSSCVSYVILYAFEREKARQIFSFMASFSVTASLWILLFIGVDRFVAIRFPLRHLRWVAKNYIRNCIIFSWCFLAVETMGFALVAILNPKNMHGAVYFYQNGISFIIFTATLVLIIFYGLIMYTGIKRQRESHKLHGNIGPCRTCGKEKALLLTCLLVMVSFDICMVPFALEIFITKNSHLELLMVANSALNPLVYFFKGPLQRRMTSMVHKHKETRTTDQNAQPPDHRACHNGPLNHACCQECNSIQLQPVAN